MMFLLKLKVIPLLLVAIVVLGLLVLVLAMALGFVAGKTGTMLTDNLVQATMVATIQKETQQSFLSCGELQENATVPGRAQTSMNLMVRNVVIGTTEVVISCPGTVSYGFLLDDFNAVNVSVKNGSAFIELPPISVYMVEPHLDRAEIVLVKGSNRLRPSAVDKARNEALANINKVLRLQAEESISTGGKAKPFCARAVAKMFSKSLIANGLMQHVKEFRFKIGNDEMIIPAVPTTMESTTKESS